MPEEAIHTVKPKVEKKKTTNTPVKKVKDDARLTHLEELMSELCSKLAFLNENHLKDAVKKEVVAMRKAMDEVEHHHQRLCEILNYEWGEINF